MGNLGIGVMIGLVRGNKETVETVLGALGKEITALDLDEDRLLLTFVDDTRIKLFDDGQSCCEERYMHSDDDLQYFVGTELVDIELREAPDVETEYEVHEVQFLVVTTAKGSFTVETHNVHNGYYGGFLIRAEVVDSEKGQT